MKMLRRILMAFVLLGLVSCGLCKAGGHRELEVTSKDTVSVSALGHLEGDKILIEHDVDLKWAVCIIPKGKTLVFKNGTLRNGTLIGNNTQIEGKKNAFDKVTIQGKWDVPEISTRLFKDLSYENALKDVVALSSPKVKNTIIIESGDYIVKARKGAVTCISICDNTELIINGTICLLPNDLTGCNIIAASGNNINIKGKGTIIGDKHTHTGTEGEWGMGINLKGAVNTTVTGLTIKDCWGDCIYVGGGSKDVLIERCTLDHGRRQGISVTKADGVTIRNCTITNVSGTNPQYAIDLEPNKNDTIDHVLIENVEVVNCEGGFLSTFGRSADGKRIGEVTIRNCKVSAKSKMPIRQSGCEKVVLENNNIYSKPNIQAIRALNIQHLVIRDNTITITNDIIASFKKKIKAVMGNEGIAPIDVKNVERQELSNNKIIEQ